MNTKPTLNLYQFEYKNLFNTAGLQELDQQFCDFLSKKSPEIAAQLQAYRQHELELSPAETSEFLISCSHFLETFLAQLFQIEEAVAIAQAQTTSQNPVSAFKKYYIQRRAKKELKKIAEFPSFDELNQWREQALKTATLQSSDQEMATALLGTEWLADPEQNKANIDQLVAWCAQAMCDNKGQELTKDWTSFRLPQRLDYQNLVPCETVDENHIERKVAAKSSWRQRDGFKLTDERMSAREVQDEINYCVFCHDHDGDFCSKGFPVKKGEPEKGLKENPLDLTMTGCPLEEKISEMNVLKRDGYTLASLAMVMVDNPMCPATGHRICNDCMKACIYQKQTPVNVPQIETRVLTDVLSLPWGVEIYDLLTRWNPLRQKQWIMKPYNGLKVLIAGMGPAGFTLAHHLLQEGFAVVGFDGLKIEPLDEKLINQPIHKFEDLKEALDERLMAGFGGVAEYGITVRWDKNFLKLIYLCLMRRPYFQVFGSVRFGGTITVEDAWELGFDHLALAVGAGLPKALNIPHSLAPGMRQANDFLMALQLNNAAKKSSMANLQVRMPAVVIGGGLTGVDTATEVQAYYISQVEKVLDRYEQLKDHYSKDEVLSKLDIASKEILLEFIEHGQAVRKERERAKENNEAPNFIKLIHQWGGVTIAYRRSMQESPAYINNHEELQKALEEGIYYAEGLEPTAVELNQFGHAETLECNKRLRNESGEWISTKETVKLPARCILVATGTQPNTAYEFEHKGTFNRLNLQYQHYEERDGELQVAHGVKHCKESHFGAFTSYAKHDKRVSLIGDTHPVFHGNVVKAIASGMRTYPKILENLAHKISQNPDKQDYQLFAEKMHHLFTATVSKLERINNDTILLSVRAPLAAKRYQPGQFYRLQNFETYSAEFAQTQLQMEAMALIATRHDKQPDELEFIIKDDTATGKICSTLQVNTPIALMGPTGVRAKVSHEHETVLIVGNEDSFPFVLSYGTAMRAAGNHVIFICQLKPEKEPYCVDALKNATNEIHWLHDDRDIITAIKPVLDEHCQASAKINYNDVDRIYVIGNTTMLKHFQIAREQLAKDYFFKDPKVIGAVYGNMQCMLKGVCAQCLQWQIDPETGKRTKAVFACSWQDQPLEIIDLSHIDERKAQNRLMENLNLQWIDYVFETHQVERV